MANELEKLDSNKIITDIKNTQEMCRLLMNAPHYKRMGVEGVCAIVEKAKSIGISPLEALNGGMYYVQGKVELTSGMMNQLIRMNGHSITKDKRSDDSVCILHGKRKDNGDTWVESFSIEDAKKAGIYKNQWIKYPKDMLFARALSRLARQLFPDIIKGCYVQGEILETPVESLVQSAEEEVIEPDEVVFDEPPESISEDQYYAIENALGGNDDLRDNILGFMKKRWGLESLSQMPMIIFEHSMKRAKEAAKDKEEIEDQAVGI
jgi:hypothetical protein